MKVIKKAVTRVQEFSSFMSFRCAEWAAHHKPKMYNRGNLSFKIRAIFIALLMLLSSVSFFIMANAAEPIPSTLELEWTSKSFEEGHIKPGEEMEITVSLKNYSNTSNPLINAIQIEVPFDTDLLEYVSGTALLIAEATDTNKVSCINNIIRFTYWSFNDDFIPLSRSNSDLFKFTVKAKAIIDSDANTVLKASKVTVADENAKEISIGGPREFIVPIYLEDPVMWLDLTANGTSNTVNTTKLTLTFDKPITGLTSDNITVTGATKGTLAGSGDTWTLDISDITVPNEASITLALSNPAGYRIAPLIKTTVVYVIEPLTNPSSANPTSQTNTTSPTETLINADNWLEFKLNPITIYPQKMTITGETTKWNGSEDTVIKISVNDVVLTEKIVLGNPKEFSIEADFTRCKAGDSVCIYSAYLGETGYIGNNMYLVIWPQTYYFTIQPNPTQPSSSIPSTATVTDPTQPVSSTAATVTTDPTQPGNSTTATVTDPAQSGSSIPSTQLTTVQQELYLLGDADQDRKITVKDATVVQKHVAKIISLKGNALRAADSDEDSKVTVKDATVIQKYVAKIKVSSRVGQWIPVIS